MSMRKLQESTGDPLSLFISYAREDEPLRQQLEVHLSLLRRQGLIADWHDRQILAGNEWAHNIDEHLNSASVILLLISPDFFASDYCYGVEMKHALERHLRDEAHIIPIIVRPCDWHHAPFAHLQCLPYDGKAITEWDNQDAAFRDIAKNIHIAIEQIWGIRPPSVPARQNRDRLIKKVHSFWIEGVLEYSLHHTPSILLNLHEKPDAIENPWRLDVQESILPARPFPSGTRITKVFDRVDGKLLVLGEPGAGKTTLLLELAQDLLDRCKRDSTYPIPVIFNLSSWAERQPPLTVWLVEELHKKYQVPRKLGQTWIGTDQILLLLDGLDEVISTQRSACIESINAYRQEHPFVPVVVCSRHTEYLSQSLRLLLESAIVIQPLTALQIDECLSSAGEYLEAVRMILHADVSLRELATTPFMLSILALAFYGKSEEDVKKLMSPQTNFQHLQTLLFLQQQRQHILLQSVFAVYIERVLQHRSVLIHFTPQQMVHWLTQLAQQLARNHQTEFYLEQMQPSWLLKYSLLFTYGIVVECCFLLVVVAFELLIFLLFFMRFFALFPWLNLLILCTVVLRWAHALYYNQIIGPAKEIKPAEIITWSWTEIQQKLHSRRGRLAFLLNLLCLFGTWLSSTELFGRSIGLSTVLAFAFATTILFGFSHQRMEKSERVVPNQGIRRSARYSIIFMFAIGLSTGVLTALLSRNWHIGLCAGLGVGLVAGYYQGGYAWFQHIVLRSFLWATGQIPYHYVRFLDYATEHILLRKVGGGYIFVHRLLLDYFASLETPPPKNSP